MMMIWAAIKWLSDLMIMYSSFDPIKALSRSHWLRRKLYGRGRRERRRKALICNEVPFSFEQS